MLFAAVAWSWPTTFGTGLVGCGFGPADTTSATRELRRAVQPAAGTCSSTRFAGLLDLRETKVGLRPGVCSCRSAGVCASAVTRGTRTLAAAVVVVVVVRVVVATVVVGTVVVEGVPVETFSVTFEPLSTSLPAGGFCATTTPAGFADPTLCSTGSRPAPVSAFTADPCVCPTTCGTTTGFAPLYTLSLTVVPVTAVTPARGA